MLLNNGLKNSRIVLHSNWKCICVNIKLVLFLEIPQKKNVFYYGIRKYNYFHLKYFPENNGQKLFDKKIQKSHLS